MSCVWRRGSSRSSERGTAILEFPFAGIPLIVLLMVVFEICIAMWSYHTLALAVKTGAAYASTKGKDCTYTPNSCQVSIGQIVQRVLAAGVGLDANQLKVTLTWSVWNAQQQTSQVQQLSCTPASNCISNTNPWAGGFPGIDYIEIDATYPAPISIPALFWPGQSLSAIGTVQFSASSQQRIQF